MINILIVGSGGREHAIVKALYRTNKTNLISIHYLSTNENPALTRMCEPNPPHIVTDYKISTLAIHMNKHFIDKLSYVIIGPEAPLEEGYTDYFQAYNVNVIGPTKENSKIETSKNYCRTLLASNRKLAVYQPIFRFFDPKIESVEETIHYIRENLGENYVVKQDGLCGGKGVKVSGDHLHNLSETTDHLNSLTTSYLIEEKLIGEEFSLITLTDGINHLHFPPVQDFKRLNNGNKGPNTGSMGAYTLPDHTLPFLTPEEIYECHHINEETVKTLNNRHIKRYTGFLYGSFMKTDTGIKIIEYNARLGDPEAINLMELVNTDLNLLFKRTIKQELDYYNTHLDNIFHPYATVTKYLVPEGYPTNPIKNFPITFSTDVPINSLIYASIRKTTNFHGETYYEGMGSRTLAIITNASTITDAATKAELYASKIKGKLHYRTDIGKIFTTASTPLSKPTSAYEDAGVSIDEGNRVVEAIRASIESTYTPKVIPNFGDFGGLYRINKDRILVASTDGVGTKTEHLKHILKHNPKLLYQTLGQDIVNHCVNDILVKNAYPLFFLDYFATSSLDHKHVQYFVEGVSKSCQETGTALLGGETAEMPSVYTESSFDIAGTIVGETSPETMFNGKADVTDKTKIYYLQSSGPHTNGYSLIRKIYTTITSETLSPEDTHLLNTYTTQPHRCYLQEIKTLQDNNVKIQALCHITGGGLIDNPERVSPQHLKTNINIRHIFDNLPKGFRILQSLGKISNDEMLRVFNCGIGLLIYLSPEYAPLAQKILPELRLIGFMSNKE
jgi:phosphoribosylamine--glycine ligase / phosphoribosylformylglycinamidine cyclo-ligase